MSRGNSGHDRWSFRGGLSRVSSFKSGEDGTIPGMTSKEMLTDEELGVLASEWRMKALQGDLHARGIAHEYEREMRRRAGAPLTNYDTLDLRSLEMRTAKRRWWQLWRAD